MINPTEKARLKNREALTSKAKANLDYRVAQKIKKYLSALGEVNEALNTIPEKNAMRVLNTDMVTDIFALTENMLRILRFSPVGLDIRGNGYITRFGPGKQSKDGTMEFKASVENGTSEDVFRHVLVDDHLKELHRCVDLHQVALPGGMPLIPLFDAHAHSQTVVEGFDRYRKLGRKGLGPDAKMFGYK